MDRHFIDVMKSNHTIAAIATGPGPAALAMIRISGSDSARIGDAIFTGSLKPSAMESHLLHYGHIVDAGGARLDEAMLVVLRPPHSFTAEQMVEITCHGGGAAAGAVLEAALAAGARPARPGEFSLRAFLNGRIDLAQAEAVCDIINARTGTAARAALERLSGGLSRKIAAVRESLLDAAALVESLIDFPEEDIPPAESGKLINDIDRAREQIARVLAGSKAAMVLKDGARVVIAGRPNVGKSSLFNMLLKEEKAIVTETPGTTRDVLEGWIDIGGIPVRLFDTAGLRDTLDEIESHGMERARGKLEQADLVLLVLDGTGPMDQEDEKLLSQTEKYARLILVNKCDLSQSLVNGTGGSWLKISAVTEEGLPELESSIVARLTDGQGIEPGAASAANARQAQLMGECLKHLEVARNGLQQKLSYDLLASDLKAAIDALGQITGQTIGDDILDRIFEKFCIGK
ncbi:TPA: tRNA uridine-5-carboxymethylaminomethyl(34) synthesis GTPase MnmE [Candidatus Edwardsbacteria bacterium]|nr:tRNA uridine-5-carboxymethylaminomethyl(34) synthesis GTPase MnmE [Candidatus Edwardsbacteria bacterium]HBZ86897.1 tRNA uridine-5-carboxymethylaminomethyl(34) synthesis GTPase MnmE [Candidatus Edwardsbacteria bacterium]